MDTKEFFTEYGEANRYTIKEVIGKGSYGVVCSATDTKTGEKVAIKKINNVFDHVSDATRILREIKLLRLLRHPGAARGAAGCVCRALWLCVSLQQQARLTRAGMCTLCPRQQVAGQLADCRPHTRSSSSSSSSRPGGRLAELMRLPVVQTSWRSSTSCCRRARASSATSSSCSSSWRPISTRHVLLEAGRLSPHAALCS